MPNEMIVPIDALYEYVNSPQWCQYAFAIKSVLVNYTCKKCNHKKAAKYLKKAAKFLPGDLVIEVKIGTEGKK